MIAATYARTLTGRRILLTLLCLLTFATSASAEGAWVRAHISLPDSSLSWLVSF